MKKLLLLVLLPLMAAMPTSTKWVKIDYAENEAVFKLPEGYKKEITKTESLEITKYSKTDGDITLMVSINAVAATDLNYNAKKKLVDQGAESFKDALKDFTVSYTAYKDYKDEPGKLLILGDGNNTIKYWVIITNSKMYQLVCLFSNINSKEGTSHTNKLFKSFKLNK